MRWDVSPVDDDIVMAMAMAMEFVHIAHVGH